MRKVKETKGITLIALVITIIVLLILAGVAISMLSGENGILTRAAEAKDKTEIAQKEEETNLASMELETYFITNNLKYKCAYGFVTGIEVGTTVSKMQADLQSGGYELKPRNEEGFTSKNSNDEYIVTTGMQIQKDGKEFARIVIFGDTDCNGDISIVDHSNISRYTYTYNFSGEVFPDYQLAAMDVNHDGYIKPTDDSQLIVNHITVTTIEQNVYANKLKSIDKINYIDIINKLEISDEKEFKKADSQYNDYKIKLNREYTYAELKNIIQNKISCESIQFLDSAENTIESDSTDKIKKGDIIYMLPSTSQDDYTIYYEGSYIGLVVEEIKISE